ncbi:G-protein subunit alpha 12 [Tieghemostelium lacteum]|uniref:G-protein subunit alpha 12 n=1 Tax=Tieghemostelium lacteum TaxID=361077 RepID=A0A151ZCS0_TIELA|nr:G-protein subunit alpha 12 [Tieghemostelium lacteum]|eukprot:KYQ91729.1 G-protein subunit alpha 12 [Tieghemostelium lacteum]
MCMRKETTPESVISRKIDYEIKKDSQTLSTMKLLLLGGGESGKSTIFKQIISFQDENTKKEYTPSTDSITKNIFTNILTSIQTLINSLSLYQLEFTNDSDKKASERVLSVCEQLENINQSIFQAIAVDIKALWANEHIQSIFNNPKRLYLINDSSEYFFSNIDRFLSSSFKPNQTDFLRVRVKTTGIIEADFTVETVPFKIIDVGGQKNQRRKWIHCFQNITCVLFVTSLNDYDTVLEEDGATSRFSDSLGIFTEMVNSQWFLQSAFVLFLNKVDLFKEKIKKVPLNQHLTDFQGRNDSYNECSTFIKDKFITANKNPSKFVYHHFTCALDSQAIEVVFKSIQDTLLSDIVSVL